VKSLLHQFILVLVAVQMAIGPNAALATNPAPTIQNSAEVNEGQGLQGTQLQFDFDQAPQNKPPGSGQADNNSSSTDKSNPSQNAEDATANQPRLTNVVEATEEQTRQIYENESPRKFRQKMSNYLQLGPAGNEVLQDAMTGGTHGQAKLDAYAQKPRDAQIAQGAIRFTNESFTFAVANGVIQTVLLSEMYASNPVQYEQHIQTLKDPWGHLGFYAFMAVNGFTEDVLRDATLRRTHVATARWRLYSSVIPYLGMTAGSLASQFVGDFGQLMRSCGWQTLGVIDPSLALVTPKTAKKKEELKQQGQADPCEEAWRMWTIEKKFMQYLPSIGSMIASTAASGFLTYGYSKAVTGVKTAVAARQSESALFKTLYVTGAKVTVFLAGGPEAAVGKGVVFRGLQFVASKTSGFLGKVTQFTIFTGLDMAMHGWIADKLGNLMRGQRFTDWIVQSFSKKSENLQKTIESEKKSNWESSEALKYSKDFTDSMTAWKDFNQTHPMQAYYAWVQKTANLINIERLSFHFYENFINDMQSTRIQTLAKANEAEVLKASAQKIEAAEQGSEEELEGFLEETENAVDQVHESVFNRLFPLYGVKPSAVSKLTNADYLKAPSVLEKDQARTVDVMSIAFKKLLIEKKSKFSADDLRILTPIAEGMGKADVRLKGLALKKMQTLLSQLLNSGLSGYGRMYLRQIYEHLGRPTPLLNYGLSYTYAWDKAVKAGALDSNESKISGYLETAKLSQRFGPYTSFSLDPNVSTNKLDSLIYNMICGAKTSAELVNDRYGFSSVFNAPRLIDSKIKADICNFNFTQFKVSTMIYLDQIKDLNSGTSYQGAWRLILPNLSAPIKAIVNSARDSKDLRFSSWWFNLTDARINAEFKKYKQEFNKVAVDLVKTLYRTDSRLNNGVAKNAVALTWMQQIRTNTLMLGELFKDLSARTKTLTKDDFVSDSLLKMNDIKKLKNSDDLLRFQSTYYNLDYAALKAGRKPSLLKFQYEVEKLITSYKNVTSKLVVVEKNGKEQVEKKFTPAELENYKTQQKALEESLRATVAELAKRTALTKKQNQLVSDLSKNILSMTQELDNLLGYLAVVDRDSGKPQTAAQGKCQTRTGGVGAARGGQFGNCP
jgi:hypothetical protein